ncbi:LacI family DNA-binding transcriptional regulator [Bifidobacterium sp. ESL0682]|uniref:LacI family DNA-binding transcriptional regulator n=1 Tax=Bifidobacterium sp. ESL0682 TaxID=2983212 RepID=UPI0023F90121|nr:LacI family DNA-binding transcriptional regulator [Bifidobacterium sp. ESL0682]WEV42118.1 LacI family DNA-binding transcriptional regulator [Bifidobacterium sp. ESL0682]
MDTEENAYPADHGTLEIDHMNASKDLQQTTTNNSIVDVAVMAKVSIATVSRVLSGNRNKHDDIDKRVRQAADKLHYSVNPAAKALRSKVSGFLGVVAPKPIDFSASQLLSELEPAAKKMGKDVILTLATDQKELDDKAKSLIQRDIDGLIAIPPAGCQLSLPADEPAMPDIPAIQLLGHNAPSHVSWIGLDITAAMHEAVQQLADVNATSIAFLSRSLDSGAVSDALVEFQASDQITGLIREPGWTTFGPCTINRGHDDTLRLFSGKEKRPNAIICGDDQIALGALDALKQLHINVPDEVTVISFGDSPLATMTTPTLTSIRPPYRTMVDEALRLLTMNEKGTHHLHPHTTFPPEVISHESTPKLMRP